MQHFRIMPGLGGFDRLGEPAIGFCSAGLMIAVGSAVGSEDRVLTLLFWTLAAGFAVFIGLFLLHVWTNRSLIQESKSQREISERLITKLGEVVMAERNVSASVEKNVGQMLNALNEHSQRSISAYAILEEKLLTTVADLTANNQKLIDALHSTTKKNEATNG